MIFMTKYKCECCGRWYDRNEVRNDVNLYIQTTYDWPDFDYVKYLKHQKLCDECTVNLICSDLDRD